MDRWQKKIGDGAAGYLAPGETVLATMSAAVKGRSQSYAGNMMIGTSQQNRSRTAAEAAGVTLPFGTIGVVITQRRLLLFELGVGAKIKQLVSEVPIGDVDSIQVKRFGLAGTTSIFIRGQQVRLEGRVGPGRELIAGLATARQMLA
jgi:hypothetical protein